MRFEDERYVRVYTRDTMTWLMLPWQSKCVIPLVARKLDRAGVLDLGEHGIAGLAAMIQVPFEIVDPGIAGALAGNVFELRETLLVWPRFLEAQEARQSDKARARTSRERARDLNRAESHGVSAPSQTVTEATADERERHTRSHDVTPYCAVPSRTDLKTKDLSVPPTPVESATKTKTKKPTQADDVYEYWLDCRQRFNPRAKRIKVSEKDRKAILALLASGRSPEEMKLACQGHFLSPHHTGENDRATQYLAFEFVVRPKNVDTFIALAEAARPEEPIASTAKPNGPIVPAPPEFRAYLDRQAAKTKAEQAELPIAASANVLWKPKATGSNT